MDIQKKPLKILHTSDIHLGAYDKKSGRFSNEKKMLQEAHFIKIIDLGIEHDVDAFLIPGDLFDNARVDNETLELFANQIKRLGVPTIVSPGNHDHVGPGSVYDRIDLFAIADNLFVMRNESGEPIIIDELSLKIWGKAHTEELPDFRPFSNPPERAYDGWYICMGHGHYIHPNALQRHSFHISCKEILELNCDYVALGHWEQFTRVESGDKAVAAYSGAPESLAYESGIGGRVLIVNLHPQNGVTLSAVSINGEPVINHKDIPYLYADKEYEYTAN
jgi:DNA repair exonuclease SbcCD nuclease subunit